MLLDRNPEVEDEWEKYSESLLMHMESGEWKECQDTIGLMFTSGDESKDEEGITLDRYLEVGKGDAIFANSKRKREIAYGEVSLDINSILALFTDLSVINTVISLSIVSNPVKNLKKSIHIIHKGTPLHWILHFHLGQFGHDSQFDLYMFLPALFNKNRRQLKNNLSIAFLK